MANINEGFSGHREFWEREGKVINQNKSKQGMKDDR